MGAAVLISRPSTEEEREASIAASDTEARVLRAELSAASARNNAATNSVVAQSEVLSGSEERVRNTLRALVDSMGNGHHGSDDRTD